MMVLHLNGDWISILDRQLNKSEYSEVRTTWEYLNLPVGTHLIRTDNGKFIEDDGQAIVFEKQ